MRQLAVAGGIHTRLNDITCRAIQWAHADNNLSAIIVPRSNTQYVSVYVEDNTHLEQIQARWDCTQLEAVYSALRQYLEHNNCHLD